MMKEPARSSRGMQAFDSRSTVVVPTTESDGAAKAEEQLFRTGLPMRRNHSIVHRRSVDLTEKERRQDCGVFNHLELADATAVATRPIALGAEKGAPTNIMMWCFLKKICKIDPIMSNVDLNCVLELRWNAPHLKGMRIDKSKLWTPKIDVINFDRLNYTHEEPWFYPTTGDCRQIIIISGTVANEMDLRPFPFDSDCIKVLICCEQGTGDTRVRLHWDYTKPEDSHLQITPNFVQGQLDEWKVHPQLNSVRRIVYIPNLTGRQTGIEIRVPIQRRSTYFVCKIMSVMWLVTLSSFSCFFIHDGGIVRERAFDSRLNFGAALLLTQVSFLYISQDSLPKLAYLTLFDFIALSSLGTIVLVLLEALMEYLLAEMYCVTRSDAASPVSNSTRYFSCSQQELMDTCSFWAKVGIVVIFVATQAGLILRGIISRSANGKAVMKDKIGVEPCLLLRKAALERDHPKWYEGEQERAEARLSGLGTTQAEYDKMMRG